MIARRLLQILRVLFLGICSLAATTQFIWERHPDWVFWVDEHLKSHSIHRERRELQRGRELLQAGERAQGLEELGRLADSMENVLNGDRLGPTRVQTLRALIEGHDAAGDLDKALRRSDELHAFDPRLVASELERASLLSRTGKTDQAMATLAPIRALTKIASLEISTRLLTELIRAGDVDGALELLVALGDRGPLGWPLHGWEVRQRTADGWSAPSRFSFSPPDQPGTAHYDTTIELPAKGPDGQPAAWAELRIDAPRGAAFRLRAPTLTLLAPDGTVAGEFGMNDMGKPRHMVLEDDVLSAFGHADPYITVPSPGTEPLSALSLRLQFELQTALPANLLEVLAGPMAADSVSRLRKKLEAEDSWDRQGFVPGQAEDAPSPRRLVERLEALLDV